MLLVSSFVWFSWYHSCYSSSSEDLGEFAEAVSSLKFIWKSPSSPKALECLKHQ